MTVRLIAVTGGPGAGKTAVLELARRELERHVLVLPESASILYGGGFPRGPGTLERRAAQHAIFHVQRQLERIAQGRGDVSVALCDRGTIDGLAYWPGGETEYWAEVGTTREAELARYAAVVHLRTPPIAGGYPTGGNPLRIESAAEAAEIDARILTAWAGHPHRTLIPWSPDFLRKALSAVAALRAAIEVDPLAPRGNRTASRATG